MRVLGRYTQGSGERKRYTIEYSEWLGDDILSEMSFAVEPTTTPPFVINGHLIADSETLVSFFASGGEDGEIYTVTVTATTAAGEIKEDQIIYSVRDL